MPSWHGPTRPTVPEPAIVSVRRSTSPWKRHGPFVPEPHSPTNSIPPNRGSHGSHDVRSDVEILDVSGNVIATVPDGAVVFEPLPPPVPQVWVEELFAYQEAFTASFLLGLEDLFGEK